MRKKLLLILVVTLTALLPITFFVKEKTMNIAAENVAKIECLNLQTIIGEYSDIDEITALVNFLNSFALTKRYELVDCQRPSTNIIIYYKDGSNEHIVYRYTSLVYHDKGYEIDINRTDELDRLLSELKH